jgi:predicted dehydrogenase
MSQKPLALVVGYGSIGKRHARVLVELGCAVAVVSRRTVDFPTVFPELRTALHEWKPDYVVIANRTHEHYGALDLLAKAGFAGKVLVEKPLSDVYATPPAAKFSLFAVAYNLRFHPLLSKLKDILDGEKNMITANIYVGHYLPLWRPESDYRQNYSAWAREGGGVLRDISHELDYVSWLFGDWQRLCALGGRFSDLEIDSDDCFSVLMATARCPLISIHMNYLDRVARREIIVNTAKHTYRADFVNAVLDIDGTPESFPAERDSTYRSQHSAVLNGETSTLCSANSGLKVMATISAIEKANSTKMWVAQ